MAFSLHGAHVPHRKNTADMPAVRIPVPAEVTLATSMHIGKPAIPCVKAGDKVYVGTLVAEQDGYISSPVHSSVSGTVKKIDEILLSNGNLVKAVVIESDGEMTPDPNIAPPEINSREELIDAIKKSGIVGLGGAGFPTYVKFDVDPARIEALIINGAECEPYITSDNCTMIDRADDMAYALWLFKKHLGIERIIIGIEKNKPDAIQSMKALAAKIDGVEVKTLPSVYPQGGEKVLIYHTTGKTVPVGKLPIDVGCVVCNCTTLAEIGRYALSGMPLFEKCVTVDGSAVTTPKNVIAPIGTSLQTLFDFCGGFKSEPGKILYGGPMMGVSAPDTDVPIFKNTNAVLAFNEKDAVLPKPQPCIRCGRCVNVCPFGINPPLIAKAFKNGDLDTVEKLGLDACMECGCCSFVCPAHRPIVQNNKLAKAALREARAAKKAKEAK